MAKLTIMKGLPGCGKSTRSKVIMQERGGTVRLNKDLLRTMLHHDKWGGKNEGLTQDAETVLANWFLGKGVNVIIDDTNLNPKVFNAWKEFGGHHAHQVEVIDMTDISIEQCVLQDSTREKYVGGTVIKNMAMQWGLKKFEPQSVVLCDIDGTIANLDHRLHFVQGGQKDWKGFFGAMSEDTVRHDVQKILVDKYNQGKTIIFFSARPEDYLEQTLAWLDKHYLSFAWTVVMRRKNDKRVDTDTKKDMFDKHFPDPSVIDMVLDDRPSVIRLWKSMGLNVLDVGKGIEF